jgi:hypothetical protein
MHKIVTWVTTEARKNEKDQYERLQRVSSEEEHNVKVESSHLRSRVIWLYYLENWRKMRI